MGKKISRKKLLKEPDEFLTFSTRMLNYLSAHKREAIGAFGLVLLAVLIFNAVQFFAQRSEQRAFALLNQTLQQYEDVFTEESAEEAYLAVKPDFEALLSQYSRRTAARMGRVQYANMAFEAQDYAVARSLYQQALKDFEKQPFYHSLILSSLGHVQKAQEDYPAAIQSFEALIGSAQAPLKDQALFILSRLYTLVGDEAGHARVVDRLMADHENSLYIDLVKQPQPKDLPHVDS